MTINWLKEQPHRCYFYPARDCPGWHIGQPCNPRCLRIGDAIPAETDEP